MEGYGQGKSTEHFLGKIYTLEDTRKFQLQRIVKIQTCFRGHQARHYFFNLKQGTSRLQSFIRGEITRKELQLLVKRKRAALIIQRHVKEWNAWKAFKDQKKPVIAMQSVIRGWLGRRIYEILRTIENSQAKLCKMDQSDFRKKHFGALPCILAELNARAIKAEAALREKDCEKRTLKQQLKQYETKWLENEAKMKSKEEAWQREFTSLQKSITAVRKNVPVSNIGSHFQQSNSPEILHRYDSGCTKPPSSEGMPFNGSPKSESAYNMVSSLIQEFQQRKDFFMEYSGFLIDVKSRQIVDPDINPDEELRKLKMIFSIWKKEYKARLLETKASLQKLGSSEPEKNRRKWWGVRPSCGL